MQDDDVASNVLLNLLYHLNCTILFLYLLFLNGLPCLNKGDNNNAFDYGASI